MKHKAETPLKAFGGLVILALIPLSYMAVWSDDWKFILKLIASDIMTVFFIALILKALKDKE